LILDWFSGSFRYEESNIFFEAKKRSRHATSWEGSMPGARHLGFIGNQFFRWKVIGDIL